MWAFFSRRFRLWLMVAIGIPLFRRLVGGAGDALEARRGPSVVTKGLRGTDDFLARYERKGRRSARKGLHKLTSGR